MKHNHLYLITFAYAFSIFAQGILMPIYAFFVQKIGGGILETSYAIALYSIITGVGTILIHKTQLSHTYRKQFLWGGWFLWLLSVTAYLFMTSTVMLYMTEILSGIGASLSQPVFDAEFSQKTSKDLSGGWALFEGITSIFNGGASIFGGFIVTWYGFETLINCMIVVALFSFLLIVYYTHGTEEPKQELNKCCCG